MHASTDRDTTSLVGNKHAILLVIRLEHHAVVHRAQCRRVYTSMRKKTIMAKSTFNSTIPSAKTHSP
jgi:hypothetical protein